MWTRRHRPDPLEAVEARKKSERMLAERRADTFRVRALLAEWNRIHEQNGISAGLEESMRRSR